eukprot:Tamp_27767.p1 GENE.Tamp_27767~~Tamp_27767.p1  ORF type:complete len:106 (-),score=13.32 Tamp_27767:369-686(-)
MPGVGVSFERACARVCGRVCGPALSVRAIYLPLDIHERTGPYIPPRLDYYLSLFPLSLPSLPLCAVYQQQSKLTRNQKVCVRVCDADREREYVRERERERERQEE